MKKIVLLSSICAMGAVFAADPIEGLNDSSNVIGALANPTDGKPQKILVAVPFLGYGSSDSDVNVNDLIATANLPVGTILRVVNKIDGRDITDWDCWQLDSESVWQPIPGILVESGTQTEKTQKSVGDVSVGRGSSFWLEFPAGEKPGSFLTAANLTWVFN